MERPPFVTRERELRGLDDHLERALASQGRVCFVVGEAGCGKTALVSEFARRAQEDHQDLVVAVGQSDAQTGAGDPYLPFREILSQLTGDVDAKLAQGAITAENASRLQKLLVFSGRALVEVGPDLIDLFVPWVGLATRAAAFAAERVGWLDRLEKLGGRARAGMSEGINRLTIEQDHIFEQYTNVLTKLAEKQPLLLVLDDLHWADSASSGLLFRLGRRIGGSRILIVGTYRPEEVALGRGGGRHPLEKVLAEFKRYYGDTTIDLDTGGDIDGRRFVDAILDTEPNSLGEKFRQALYNHTDGHPLFTIELLRDMQERGDLILDQTRGWVEGSNLDWEAFPARVEGVIEERIKRLEVELSEVLTVASVEGEDFTAEVVARVQSKDARGLIRRLSRELEKQHRLVSARGTQRLNGQRLSTYRFQHNLFQAYLYNELTPSERAYLHEDIGTVLEALYGDQRDQIAVQLARHFVEAGITEKAVFYLRRAGEQAAAQYANQEAESYFSQALAMLTPADGIADLSPSELQQCYELHLAREEVYTTLGQREAQQQDLAALEQLAEELDEDTVRGTVSLRRARYAEATGDYPEALEALEGALTFALTAGDVKQEAQAVRGLGYILWRKGDFKEARLQLERALELASKAGLPEVQAVALHSLAVVHWRLGKLDQAREYASQAIDQGGEIGSHLIVGMGTNVLGNIELTQGNYAAAKGYYTEDLEYCRRMGHLRHEAMCLGNLGIISEIQGDYASALAHFEQARAIFQDIGDRGSEARAWGHMGLNSECQGGYKQARDYYQRALDIYQEIDNQQGQSWVLKTYASLLHKIGDYPKAVTFSRKSLDIARESGALSMQAAAWTTLATALTHQGQYDAAADAYQHSLEIRRQLEEQNLVMESLGGLARVALERGEPARAKELVEEVLTYIQDKPIEGTDEPLDIYLTCYRVLRADEDPRAGEILSTAHTILQECAAKISDPTVRRSFLENVTPHREIVRQFTQK